MGVADGEVALEGERDDHEDRGAHGDVRHHVGVLHHRGKVVWKAQREAVLLEMNFEFGANHYPWR